MPDIYGPFDPELDVNGDPIPGTGVWAQTEWYKYAPTWAPSGVVGSPAASASAGSFGLTVSGLNITMALGRAWVYGAGYERTTTAFTAAIPANTNSNPRRDRLVLRRDLAAKTVTPVVIQGTPAASPALPTIQQNDTGQFDLTLFSWTTPGSSGAPLTNVVDERLWVSPASGDGSAGGRVVAYGSSATSQTATSTVTRVTGGLNVAPSLTPGRLYEAQLSALGSTNAASLTVTLRAIAGATAPTNSTGTVVGGSSIASGSGGPVALAGWFTVGAAGTYTISPFIVSNNGDLGPVGSVPMTIVIRDAGPALGLVGTTPIAVP